MTLPQKKYRENKKQMSFFKRESTEHGGSIGVGKRKKYRPLDTRLPLHVILRSEKAKKRLALVNFQRRIERILKKMAIKFHVSIYERNINFNHIHLLIRCRNRRGLQNFFRSVAALIAREVTGARKGRPFGKFWSQLLYSNIVKSWKRHFQNVRNYIVQNNLETWGLVPYKKRKFHVANTS